MTSKCIYIYNIKLNEENTQFKMKIKNSNKMYIYLQYQVK